MIRPARTFFVHDVVETFGGLDLLVNNASSLGATPLPALADYPLDAFREAFETNAVAPLALAQAPSVPSDGSERRLY